MPEGTPRSTRRKMAKAAVFFLVLFVLFFVVVQVLKVLTTNRLFAPFIGRYVFETVQGGIRQKPGDHLSILLGPKGFLRLYVEHDHMSYDLVMTGKDELAVTPGGNKFKFDRDPSGNITGLSVEPNRYGLVFTAGKISDSPVVEH